MKLPFLYVYGAFVWKAVLVLLVIASWLVIRLVNRGLAGYRSRSLLRWAQRREQPLDLGWRVMHGRIVSGWAETTDGLEWHRARRSDELVIEVARLKVVVVGDVRVTLGAAAHRSSDYPARKRVGEGDEVYVTGTVRRIGDDTWEVIAPPASPDASVELTAKHYARPHGHMSTTWAISWAVIVAIPWFFGLRAVGDRALSEARRAQGPFSEVASFDALAIAAAMPGSRDEVLDVLEDRFARKSEHSEESLKVWVELYERHGCAFDKMLELLRYEDALAAARRCGTKAGEATALAFLGRYEEAAAIADETSYIALLSKMALGRFRDAAHGIEVKSGRTCFSAYLRVLGGETDAFVSVTLDESVCPVLRAAVKPRAEAIRELDALKLERSTGEYYLRSDLLHSLGHGRGWGASALRGSGEPTIWFADAAIEHSGDIHPHDERPNEVQGMYMARVLRDLYRNDRQAARVDLGVGLAMYLYSPRMHEDLVLLDPATPAPIVDYWDSRPHAHVRYLDRRNVAVDCDADLVEFAFARASRGDGRELAAVTHDCRFYGTSSTELIDVGHRVVTHRAEIAAALRLQPSASISGGWVGEIPFQLIHDLFLNREVARAFGDDAQVRRLQSIIDRHYAVLSDPKIAQALLVLDALN